MRRWIIERESAAGECYGAQIITAGYFVAEAQFEATEPLPGERLLFEYSDPANYDARILGVKTAADWKVRP